MSERTRALERQLDGHPNTQSKTEQREERMRDLTKHIHCLPIEQQDVIFCNMRYAIAGDIRYIHNKDLDLENDAWIEWRDRIIKELSKPGNLLLNLEKII
jgi:hypothetical protein